MPLTLFDFTFPPNWGSQVTERLEWTTDILASTRGHEQRRALRWWPRRSYEFSCLLFGVDRQRFDNSMAKGAAGEWRVPIWHEGRPLNAGKPANGSFAVISDVHLCPDFAVNRHVFLYEAHTRTWGRYRIINYDNNVLQIVEGPAYDWSINTVVYPSVLARLNEQPSKLRQTDDALTVSMQFHDVTPRAHPGDTNVVPGYGYAISSPFVPFTYDSAPLLTRRPSEGRPGSLSSRNEVNISELDDGVARPARVDIGPGSTETQGYRWWAKGRYEYRALIQFLEGMRGRQGQVWLPTFTKDFEFHEGTVAGQTVVLMLDNGFYAAGHPSEGRQDIYISFPNGGGYGLRLAGSGPNYLVMQSPLPDTLTPAQISRVSLMRLARLDQDSVEIAHMTDVAGVSTADTTFRTTPRLRSALPVVSF